MTPEEMIRRELDKRGMTMAAASRQSGVKYSTLQSALAGRMETMSEQQRALLVAYGAGLADGAKSAETQRSEPKSREEGGTWLKAKNVLPSPEG